LKTRQKRIQGQKKEANLIGETTTQEGGGKSRENSGLLLDPFLERLKKGRRERQKSTTD